MAERKYTKAEIETMLREAEIVNPKLVSDGYGEFPDGYVLTDQNIERMLSSLK